MVWGSPAVVHIQLFKIMPPGCICSAQAPGLCTGHPACPPPAPPQPLPPLLPKALVSGFQDYHLPTRACLHLLPSITTHPTGSYNVWGLPYHAIAVWVKFCSMGLFPYQPVSILIHFPVLGITGYFEYIHGVSDPLTCHRRRAAVRLFPTYS